LITGRLHDQRLFFLFSYGNAQPASLDGLRHRPAQCEHVESVSENAWEGMYMTGTLHLEDDEFAKPEGP